MDHTITAITSASGVVEHHSGDQQTFCRCHVGDVTTGFAVSWSKNILRMFKNQRCRMFNPRKVSMQDIFLKHFVESRDTA